MPRKGLYIPPEREVQAAGIELLKARGWRVWRRNVGAMVATYNGKRRMFRAGEPGQSDTWGITPDGRHFECEFKRLGKVPTEKQLEWLMSMNAPMTPAFWVDCIECLEAVAKAIEAGCYVLYLGGDNYDLVSAAGKSTWIQDGRA